MSERCPFPIENVLERIKFHRSMLLARIGQHFDPGHPAHSGTDSERIRHVLGTYWDLQGRSLWPSGPLSLRGEMKTDCSRDVKLQNVFFSDRLARQSGNVLLGLPVQSWEAVAAILTKDVSSP